MASLGERLSKGEPEAFDALYQQCADRVHHFLVARLGARDAADDVLQEVFVRLVRQRASLAAVDNLPAFVFTIARNEAIRYAERRRDTKPLTAEDLFLEARSEDPARREDAETAAALLARLPDDLREIVELKFFGSLTLREIAGLLELPAGTVATRYRTAMNRMREWMARQPS